MNTQHEDADTVQSSAYEPFPQPQTIPSGWDTSVFLLASQPASPEQVEEDLRSEEN